MLLKISKTFISKKSNVTLFYEDSNVHESIVALALCLNIKIVLSSLTAKINYTPRTRSRQRGVSGWY